MKRNDLKSVQHVRDFGQVNQKRGSVFSIVGRNNLRLEVLAHIAIYMLLLN